MFFEIPRQTAKPGVGGGEPVHGDEALPIIAVEQHLRTCCVAQPHDESGDRHAGAMASTRTISPLPQLGQHRIDSSIRLS